MDMMEAVLGSLGGLVGLVVTVLIIFAVVSRLKRGVKGPSLVLTHWAVNPQPEGGNYVEITGRAEGIVGWLLTVLKLGATTTLVVSERDVSMSIASLSGQIQQSAPHHAVTSTTCGLRKPMGYLILAIWGFIGVIPGLLAGIFPGIISLVLAVVFLVAYFISKKMLLSMTIASGPVMGLTFKKSMIEGVAVDIDALRHATTIINYLSTRPGAAPTA
jgi:hypothetical protein